MEESRNQAEDFVRRLHTSVRMQGVKVAHLRESELQYEVVRQGYLMHPRQVSFQIPVYGLLCPINDEQCEPEAVTNVASALRMKAPLPLVEIRMNRQSRKKDEFSLGS